jgi:hypothetical protein
MSEGEPVAAGSALSFEHAEFENPAAPALACAFCHRPLTDVYWQITKRTACDACRIQVQKELAASVSNARFLRALGYGALTAVAGSALWVAIGSLHVGVPYGLLALGLGYLIGKFVRKGAGGFGGRRYQILAVGLTYSAIAFSRLPALLSLAPVATAPLIALRMVGLAFISPFLNVTEDIMGLVVIGIALYQAWTLTRGLPVPVLGPFSVAASADVPVVPVPLALGTNAAD